MSDSVVPTRDPNTKRKVRLALKVLPTTRDKYLAYAEYKGEADDAGYVLDKLVENALNTEPEFRTWMVANPRAGQVENGGRKRYRKARAAA